MAVSDPLTFNASTGVWTITRDMPAGKFKFRANDDWAINFGDNDALILNQSMMDADIEYFCCR